jgi:hypothetical protein
MPFEWPYAIKGVVMLTLAQAAVPVDVVLHCRLGLVHFKSVLKDFLILGLQKVAVSSILNSNWVARVKRLFPICPIVGRHVPVIEAIPNDFGLVQILHPDVLVLVVIL